jgi:nucleoside-diphosphate-sugar epimerase
MIMSGKTKKILVTGALGQIGSSLIPALRERYGSGNVIAMDKRTPDESFTKYGPFETADATDMEAMRGLVEKYHIDTVYHLVAILSASGEKNPDLAWSVNMESLKNVLDLAKERKMRVFWPSSIAAFGPTTPKNAPQSAIMEPSTMYGITKLSGELLCHYYFSKYSVDVRSLRYPGLISYKALPGGGTTDYAVEIFHEALKHGKYKCFLSCDCILPMMYMPDAVRATMEIMEAPQSKIKVRTSYNLAAMSFSPKELADEIKKHVPGLTCTYEPDFHQPIADSWPRVIDDSSARKDWGWKHRYGLAEMTKDMLEKLEEKLRAGE